MDMSFKITRSKLHKVIIESDPLKLISGGAPENEYDGEIELLLKQLTCGSEEEILDLVYKVFKDSFGESAGLKNDYSEIEFGALTLQESDRREP